MSSQQSGSGWGQRRGRRQDHGRHHNKPRHEIKAVVEKGVDENSPVIKSFRQFAVELDAKHDKMERLVKLSRDVTIESKRIIFLLHTISGDSKKEEILKQAEIRLKQMEGTLLRAVAVELKDEDPYQFLRTYSAGLQEFIEAKTFYIYLKSEVLQNWKTIQLDLTFEMKPVPKVIEPGKSSEVDEVQTPFSEDEPVKVMTPLPPTEYVLGVADLTGELMRRCINCVGMGQIDHCYKTCAFMREIHRGFLGTNAQGYKELGRKLYVLRQSLVKTENACYTIHVRGSEVPKHLLADVLSMPEEGHDEDEGFY